MSWDEDRGTTTVGDGAPTTLRGETVVVRSSRPVDLRRIDGGRPTDRVRWGPVAAGLVAALAGYLVLELALLATGLMDAAVGDAEGAGGALWSGAAALLAFFFGGLVAAGSARWREVGDGAFHGVLVWCLGVVAFVLLALLGTGLALGTVADLGERLGVTADDVEQFDAAGARDDAREAAATTLLFLGLTAAAAAAGGAAGARLWPRRGEQDDDLDLRGSGTPS